MITGVLAAGEVSLPGQGVPQLVALALALLLCSLIGFERQLRQKSAGLRTHALVGLGSALFVLVSKYGFTDLLGTDGVSFDPSRVAAQVVSGIGFIGGGLIFVRRADVRGLTSAATIWLAAAVGCACGASLPLLATATTAAYFVVALAFPPLVRLLSRSTRTSSSMRLTYREGRGALRATLATCTSRGFRVESLDVADEGEGSSTVVLDVTGPGSVLELAGELIELPGVVSVSAGDADDDQTP
jgi:putative Mg2+ transporter-C (MgtC) family protein